MSCSEEDTEPTLKELVTQTLENNGILGKIQAELRATIFLTLEDELKEKNIPLINKRSQELLSSPVGKLASLIVEDFLLSLGLDFSLSVFGPESKFSTGDPVHMKERQGILNQLKANIKSQKDRSRPFLFHLIEEANLLKREDISNAEELQQKYISDLKLTNNKNKDTSNHTNEDFKNSLTESEHTESNSYQSSNDSKTLSKNSNSNRVSPHDHDDDDEDLQSRQSDNDTISEGEDSTSSPTISEKLDLEASVELDTPRVEHLNNEPSELSGNRPVPPIPNLTLVSDKIKDIKIYDTVDKINKENTNNEINDRKLDSKDQGSKTSKSEEMLVGESERTARFQYGEKIETGEGSEGIRSRKEEKDLKNIDVTSETTSEIIDEVDEEISDLMSSSSLISNQTQDVSASRVSNSPDYQESV